MPSSSKVVDRAQIHLGGIDKIVPHCNPRPFSTAPLPETTTRPPQDALKFSLITLCRIQQRGGDLERRVRSLSLGARHPMNPIRLALTMSLATSLGVLDDVDPLAPLDIDVPPSPGCTASIIDAVRAVRRPDGARDRRAVRTDLRSRRHGQPDFPGDAGRAHYIVGGSIAAAKAIASGQVAPRGEYRWRHAPRDGLAPRASASLQRLCDCDRLASRARLRPDRLHRHRCPPR